MSNDNEPCCFVLFGGVFCLFCFGKYPEEVPAGRRDLPSAMFTGVLLREGNKLAGKCSPCPDTQVFGHGHARCSELSSQEPSALSQALQ